MERMVAKVQLSKGKRSERVPASAVHTSRPTEMGELGVRQTDRRTRQPAAPPPTDPRIAAACAGDSPDDASNSIAEREKY